jgi:hypothetical protein
VAGGEEEGHGPVDGGELELDQLPIGQIPGVRPGPAFETVGAADRLEAIALGRFAPGRLDDPLELVEPVIGNADARGPRLEGQEPDGPNRVGLERLVPHGQPDAAVAGPDGGEVVDVAGLERPGDAPGEGLRHRPFGGRAVVEGGARPEARLGGRPGRRP